MGNFFDDVSPTTVSEAASGLGEFKVGDNHAHISSVVETISKKGNPMLDITFVNEDGKSIHYYIVDGEYKLSKLKQLYQAFEIPVGEIDTRKWIGKWGIVVCKEDKPYNGKIFNKVSYVRPNLENGTPPRSVTPNTQSNSLPPSGGGSSDDDFDDDIPF